MYMTLDNFFTTIADAAFSNPFGKERLSADLKIAGLSSDRPDRIKRVRAVLTERIAELEANGQGDLRTTPAEKRETMLIVFLFDEFHRVCDDFDRHILKQERAQDAPIPVPFARDTLDRLMRRGISAEGARHFFAVFFQMRRAFHFISRDLSGESACMQSLRTRLWSNVFTHDVHAYERFLWDRMEDFSTLLLGETGVGKGAAAAAIGRSGFIPFDEKSGRFVENFMRGYVATNLSQYPAALIESELFGHRKGAFTGAIADHEGLFSLCSPHGAVFLDEIGDVPRDIQTKLLNVLQERVFSPVGSHEPRRFRGRVIAATNRPLEQLRERGEFRSDFYYRLCSDVITVPPLRQRIQEDPDELPRLVAHIAARLTGRESPALASRIADALAAHPGPGYPWPGNVRELEQAVRRVMLTGRYDGDPPSLPAGAQALAARIERGDLSAEDLLAAYCAHLHDRLGTYEAVADRARLDRRTVKKYILRHEAQDSRVR